eukprot:2382905-Alexandrium_andersonii.AAC.1
MEDPPGAAPPRGRPGARRRPASSGALSSASLEAGVSGSAVAPAAAGWLGGFPGPPGFAELAGGLACCAGSSATTAGSS